MLMKARTGLFLLGIIAGLVLGCNDSTEPSSPMPTQGSSYLPEQTTEAEVVNLRSGATNMPTHFDTVVRIHARQGKPGAELLDAISKQTYFESNGRTISTESKLSSDDAKDGYFYVTIRPTVPLTKDAWWNLVFENSDLVEAGRNDGALARWKFFTGSAPRIAFVEVSKSSKVVYIEYSEPIDLGALDAAHALTVEGQQLSSCILQGDQCANLPDGVMGESVNLKVPDSIDTASAMDLVVALPKGLTGQGRSIAEGIGVAGGPGEIVDGVVQFHIGATEWTSCNDGDAKCWGKRHGQPD
jgi:hypothetical protein